MTERVQPKPASPSPAGSSRSGDVAPTTLAPREAVMPVERGSARIQPPPDTAGGLPAVTSALGYALRRAGVVRSTRTLLRVNQDGGFDCPSCAWPDPEHRTTFEFCENGARAVADEATRATVTPEFFATWSIPRLLEQSDQWLNAQGRITHPVVRRRGSDHYEAIGWDEAFELVAQALRGLAHPDRAIFYTSGRTSNEAAFLYQLLVRKYGTNNMPDCSNMCHESSGTGLSESIGIGKGTVQLEDFAAADAIFVVGQNPGTNHPRMLTTLREAKQRGAAIVAVNPLREPGLVRFSHPQKPRDLVMGGVELADLYLRVRVGGDIALFKGIMKAMLARERAAPGQVFDHDFIAAHTTGYEALVADLDETDWEVIERGSGVARAEMEAAAEIACRSRATIVCWAMGITQHRFGVGNVQTLVDFLLLQGNLGKKGAGVCPVRGHSNVQGDRTMGIWEKCPPWTAALERRFGFAAPREHGHDVVGAIDAMQRGKADVFIALGGNFLSAAPDTDVTAAALRRCALTVQVSTKLNRSHLVTGEAALILPCLGRTERDETGGRTQFVTVENSMGVVHTSRGTLPPASDTLRSEVGIVTSLARLLFGEDDPVPWRAFAEDYDRIRDAIEAVIPGFADYNRRVREPGGFALHNPVRERTFRTPDGKAQFVVHPVPELDPPAGQLLLTTIRSHDQFNTTVYDLDDRYRGVQGHRRVVFMNAEDLRARGLASGQRVTLRSHFEGVERVAPSFECIAFDIPIGNAAAYFPEANVLVPWDSYAEGSRTPTSKAIPITVTADPSS